MVNMVGDSFIGISHLALTGEGVGNLRWIGRCADCRCKYINQNANLIYALNLVSFNYIFQIDIGKDVLQIICFLSLALEAYNLRQSSIDHVVIPSIVVITVIDRIKLCKGEGIDSDLITSATELGHNVAGQELRVTSGNIHINIAHAKQAIQHFLKSWHELYFIQKEIILPIVFHSIFDVLEAHLGIS